MTSAPESDVYVGQVLKALEIGYFVEFPLDLTEEWYSKEAMKQILDAMVKQPDVYAQLWYTTTELSDYESDKLAELIRTSQTLQLLLLYGTISDENSLKLAAALKENRTLNCLRVDDTSTLASDEVFAQFKNTTHSADSTAGWEIRKVTGRRAYYFERYPRVDY